jgi:DNA mismatch repair protein MutS
MTLTEDYFNLTIKYQNEYGDNTILLMQVGAFFEVYGICNKETSTIAGSKISDFSQICELNIVDKNICVGKSNVVMAGVKDIGLEKAIKKIQAAGFTAVVYVQDEAAKNTSRSLAGVFSPGTYFQTESQILTNSIACVWIDYVENKVFMRGKYIVVGLANIDIYTGKTSIFQFKETYANNPTTYDELERFISIYNPSELILISNLPDEKEMDYVISYAGISSSLIHKIHIGEQDKKSCLEKKSCLDETVIENVKIKRIKNCEKQPYQKEILTKFYKFDNFDTFIQNFNENNIATQAFCYLLDFVYQHNPNLVNKISEPVFENCSTRLALANHTLKQLNIINDGTVKSTKYSCVSQMLNDCLTQMGKRKFIYNIVNPVWDEEYLQREYDITEYYLTKHDVYEQLVRSKLSSIRDLSKIERQIFLKKMPPKTFYTLNNNILIVKDMFNIIQQDKTLMDYLYINEKNIKDLEQFCDNITDFINSNIDINLAKDLEQLQNFDINFIKINIDSELDRISESLKDSEAKLEVIRSYLSGLIENKESKKYKGGTKPKTEFYSNTDDKTESKKTKTNEYVKIHETDKNNYSLISTNLRCKILQDVLPKDYTLISLSFIGLNDKTKKFDFKVAKNQFEFHKQSASNNFINDEQINALCKTITNSKVSMKDLITTVYNRIVSRFEEYQKQLETIISFITLVDVIHTKSSIAKKYNYCKPNIVKTEFENNSKSFVEAKGLRHCLIEQFQTNEVYVSNDLIIGDGNTDGILLYGTNAVGKTSLIRALGISIILAQSGLYVPCSSFNFKPYRNIFTRIIGNDNIFKGLSTFEVEMSELRTILRLMDENSLVLGDELCSGTETLSAISIFVAGIQKLHKSKSSFIFATHLHEIVNYDEITMLDSVKLKHMEVIFDKERDILIYDRKLKEGPGNSMYGLEVCKSLSLPQDFLDAAYQIRMKYHPESGSMLSLKTSQYNSKKIVNLCEKCGKESGKEVHHLQHQKDADDNGVIKTKDSIFHKNILANLMTLCESCHNDIHKKNVKHKRVKTSKGLEIQPVD